MEGSANLISAALGDASASHCTTGDTTALVQGI